MKNETLEIIHRTYVESVEKSNNIMDILNNFYDALSNMSNIDEADIMEFDSFLKGIYSSKMIRRQTFKLTNLVTDIVFVIMYLIIWLNTTKGMQLDIDLTARRKGLESELSKILSKSAHDDTASIHDRFGLRGILLNTTSPKKAKEMLLAFADYIVAILANKNRAERSLFINWIEKNDDIDSFTKERIKFILKLPFKVYLFKNYIDNPKKNGYQSFHFVLALEMFSSILPGAELEVQLRTYSMHQKSTNGSASHTIYEKNRRKDSANVFSIKDFSKVNIIGFSGYDSIEDDIDGVHFGKIFVNRRISATLV